MTVIGLGVGIQFQQVLAAPGPPVPPSDEALETTDGDPLTMTDGTGLNLTD